MDIRNKEYYQYQRERGGTSDKMYFSGANVRVYFGDIWVEEMVSIQFSIDENVAPIFGFNSYMFDKIARGTRLVSGAFILNHTESGYLNVLLDRLYKNINEESSNLLNQNNLESLVKDVSKADSDRNIEKLLQIDGKESYNGYIEDLKNSYWGPQASSDNTIYRSGEGREYDTNYFKDEEGSTTGNPLKDHGFNILIDYSPSANERDFQDCIEDMNKSGSLFQSFRSIIGVHITGENQIINPDGQPIQTQYNFVARDLDGDVSQLSMKYNQLHNQYQETSIPLSNNGSGIPKRTTPKEEKSSNSGNTSGHQSSSTGGSSASGGGGGGSR